MQHDPVTPTIAVRPYPVTAVVPSEHRGWLRNYRSLSYLPNTELYRQKVHECFSFLGILKFVFIFPIVLCQIQRSDTSFGTLEQFKYLETTFINQNFIREKIKSRLKSENACYHSVQNPFSSIRFSQVRASSYDSNKLPN
jgi:hypothetical protein